jgi:hypothetical protein
MYTSWKHVEGFEWGVTGWTDLGSAEARRGVGRALALTSLALTSLEQLWRQALGVPKRRFTFIKYMRLVIFGFCLMPARATI